MTSRSFDHRLLLLFFPGHETHSIHCATCLVICFGDLLIMLMTN
jgi:hypothetical protein